MTEYADEGGSSYKQQVRDLSLSYEEAVRYAEERQPYWLSLRHPRDSEMEWDLFDYFPAAHYEMAMEQRGDLAPDGGYSELHRGTTRSTVYYWLDPDTGAALEHTGVNEEGTVPFFPDEESAEAYLERRAERDVDGPFDDLSLYKARTRKVGDAVDVLTDQSGIEELRDEFPHKEYIVVPKCEQAFDILDQDVVLGYPMGYSDVQAGNYSERGDWRGRKIHLLGASPPKQYAVMQELTQPNLRDDPPADILGVDWNGPHKVAYLGEYWSRDGWQPADHLSIRKTVQRSLDEIKAFWQNRGVWPETEPIDLYGPAVQEPDDRIYMDRGGDPILGREELESAYVEEYVERGTWAFASETQKKFIEYRENLTPAD